MPGSAAGRGDRRGAHHDQCGGTGERGAHSFRALPWNLRAGAGLQPDPPKCGLRAAEREDRSVQLRRDLGHPGSVPPGGRRYRRPAGHTRTRHPVSVRRGLLREGDLRRGRARRARDHSASIHRRQLPDPVHERPRVPDREDHLCPRRARRDHPGHGHPGARRPGGGRGIGAGRTLDPGARRAHDQAPGRGGRPGRGARDGCPGDGGGCHHPGRPGRRRGGDSRRSSSRSWSVAWASRTASGSPASPPR